MSAYSMSLVIALVLAAATHTTAQTALSAWMPGVATNYGGPSEGMDPNTPSYGLSNGGCGYGDLSDRNSYPFYRAVGIPPGAGIQSLPTGGCGTCIEFQCVNDRTPAFQGQGDHFDLNALSFNQLAPMLIGRIDVNYRLVACAPPSSLQVQVDGSGGPGLWLRLLITTVADLGTISAVSIQGSGSSSWGAMTNTFGAAWEVDNSPSYPISLEVTSGSQTVLLSKVLATAATGTFDTSQQFSSSGSSSTSTTTTPSSGTTSSSASSGSPSSSPESSPASSSPESSPASSSPESSPASSSPESSPASSSPESSPASSSPESTSPESSPASSSPASTSPESSPSSSPESSPSSGSSPSGSDCGDNPPDANHSCAEQAAYGQCAQPWMVGFCHQSCGTTC